MYTRYCNFEYLKLRNVSTLTKRYYRKSSKHKNNAQIKKRPRWTARYCMQIKGTSSLLRQFIRGRDKEYQIFDINEL